MYEKVTENISIDTMEDIRKVIIKAKSMNTVENIYSLKLIYTGPFLTHAEEIVSLDLTDAMLYGYFNGTFHEVSVDDSTTDIVEHGTVVQHKESKMILGMVQIVKFMASERDAIIADLVKNSAM